MRKKSLSGLSEYLRWRAELLKRQNELLDEFVKNVAERLGRCAVLLFGSRARGNHLPYSDFDIAIVVEEAVDKLSLIEELRALKPRGLPLDLIILEREDLKSPVVKKMLEGAIIVYDSLQLHFPDNGDHEA
ncbi:MAG: nucleotidyltransferase domain-containing protein [Thermofilaceae archaeon]